ncbi:MAG: type II toxin-antitoxin system VapC family toxin, partial [Fimbriiglobus sp.]
MIYLLDTNTLTLAEYGTHGVPARVAAARASGDEVTTSVVTRIEALSGRFAAVLKAADGAGLAAAVRRLRGTEAFLATFRELPFDAVSIDIFDQLRADKRAGKAGRNDLLIACIALAHRATVVTRNTKDFAAVPGLPLA